MPKKTLPAWAKVGARVLVRSPAYGSRIPATAQRAIITEITSAGLLYVRTLIDEDHCKAGNIKNSPRVRASRFATSDDGASAFEFDHIVGRQKRALRPDTPENRELWRDEMREHAALMVEARRRERKAKLARDEAEALRKRRLAALEQLSNRSKHFAAALDVPKPDDSNIDELIAFVRGVIGSGDHD